jgi:hypothetical protein
MRKYFFIPFLTFLLFSTIFAQDIIENSDPTLSEKAGRTLKVKEILRITETDGEFYFKQPDQLQVDENGSVYIADEFQFLKFSSEGKFLKNMFKKGQGPGEIQRFFSFGLENDKICVHDSMSRKIILMDKAGELLEEIQLREKGAMRFIGVTEGKIIFFRFTLPELKDMTGKLVDEKNHLIAIHLDDKTERGIGIITTKWWFTQRSGVAVDPCTVILSNDGQSLYINNTQEYLINVVDVDSGKIERIIKRDYRRVKAQKKYYPEREYEFDIADFFDRGETLWVQTSTLDEKKGTLFDIFDKLGNYIDNFYMDVDGSLMAADGNSLFIRQSDEEGLVSIVKFRIEEGWTPFPR